MSLERKRGFLRPDEDGADIRPEKWGLPDYTSASQKQAKETAMNYDPGWIPEFEQPVVEEPKPLTEAELEAIRQDAYQQGLQQGQEAGFNQGFEKGKAQGLESGQAEGFELGKAEGIAAGEAHIQQQVDVFVSLANQFAQPLELMNAQVERQLVDMVLALTREVVHVEVQTNPQIILDTVRESIEALPISGHAITLKLNPEDNAIVHEAYGDEQFAARNWELVAEPSLSRGDIQIEAGESSVSYRMEDRVRSVLQNFCGVNRHQGSE